ncbi:hypothetical protein MMC07_005862 [Pseudocyphellaria aurata]|nr:hypothetical protein [Pseudocyphellaria aurata]
MPPPTQTQDRLARAQQPFFPSSSSHPGVGKGKTPITSTTSAAATVDSASASTSRGGAGEQEEDAEESESNEMWESRQNRHHAEAVLASWEMLAWYGISARESIPQIRLALQKSMLGIPTPASDVEWSDDYMYREQHEGSTAAGSAKEGKGGGRACQGSSGRGLTGRGGRGVIRRR